MALLSFLIASLAVTCLGRPAADPKPPGLTYLFTVNLTLPGPIAVGPGPSGTRTVFPISGGTFTGPKLSGKVLSVGGDWGLFDANNTFSPDAKYVLQTTDNANILVTAKGHAPHEHLDFETGSDAYKWLNNVIAIGIAQQAGGGIVSEVWQVE